MKANIPPFHVGQKVVCVVPHQGLIKGNVYTIAGFNSWFPTDGVILKELDSIPIQAGFYVWRFKPLQQQKAPLLTFEKIKYTEREEILIMN